MPDHANEMLNAADPVCFAVLGSGVQATAIAKLGLVKLQVGSEKPDRWFLMALELTPPRPLEEVEFDSISYAWLAPGEWLVTGPTKHVEGIRQHCGEMAGTGGLMTDLTHGRTVLEVSGSDARWILGSHCPIDLDHVAMPVGTACRTLFSDIGIFISRRPDRDANPCFRLIFDHTMTDYVTRLLEATITGEAR